MSSLLEGKIAQIVNKALSPHLYDVTLSRITGDADTYDPDTGVVTTSGMSHTGKGFVSDEQESFSLNGVIQQKDKKGYILAESISGVTPRTGDTFTARGNTYQVMDVQIDPARALWEMKLQE